MEQALYKAVRNDNIADATKLLQSGADANSYSTDGKLTVLIEACSRGNKQMVDLLLTKGAIVNVAAVSSYVYHQMCGKLT
jgi:ankyrin repeat protein